MSSDLNAFFRSYASAFNAADPSGITSHYQIPASIHDASGPQVFSTAEKLTEKFASYCEHFGAIGYESAQFFEGHSELLGDLGAYVDLGWRIRTSKSLEEFRTAYILHRHSDGWRILNALVYDGAAEPDVA